MIRHIAHRLRRRVDRLLHPGGRGAVLLYHRVADEPSDPYGLCMRPDRFEAQMRVVREIGRPLSLRDFANGLRHRTLPDRSIAVTFDDGYIDNLEVARPILAQHAVPGLVFMTTGPGGRAREYWWDELERALLQPGELPQQLEVDIAGKTWSWDLGADRLYTAAQQQRNRAWHLLDDDAPTLRHDVFRQLYRIIQPLVADVRTRGLDQLLAWAGYDTATIRPERRALQAGQMADLVRDGVMSVGAHTVNHPALPAQSPVAQRTEMAESKHTLEAWTGNAVAGFAYPYGLYDEESVAAARQTGFEFACSGEYRPARPGIDLHLIPRIEVAAMDGAAFRDMLQWQLR